MITSMMLMMTTPFIKKKMGSLTYGKDEEMRPEMQEIMKNLISSQLLFVAY